MRKESVDDAGWYMHVGPGAIKDSRGQHGMNFGVQDHSTMQHPTQHNLSPVEGDHETYADIHEKKADWHYKRAGRNPNASLAQAVLHDFKSRVARGWPGDK